jgi:hypothetical protein
MAMRRKRLGRVAKVFRKAYKAARAQDWEFEGHDSHNHQRWISPSGVRVNVSSTPSGGNRSIPNTIQALKKAGLEL